MLRVLLPQWQTHLCSTLLRPVAASLDRVRSLRSGRVAFCCFTRPQIVVPGHRSGTLCGVRIETLVDDGRDSAVFAHFHDVDPPGIVALEHPVLSLEFGDHAFDRALGAEWFAADDTFEGVFFLQYALRRVPCLEIESRNKGDGILGAGRFAQPALHAYAFGEAQHRAVRIVRESTGGTGRHARVAERAALKIERHAAKGCAGC